MPPGSQNDDDDKISTGHAPLDLEQLLEEKRKMLHNTRIFLQLICMDEDASRRYIREMEEQLANDVRRLENTLRSSDAPPREPEPDS